MTPEQELIAAVIGALQLGRPLPEAVHAILTTPSVQAALAKVRQTARQEGVSIGQANATTPKPEPVLRWEEVSSRRNELYLGSNVVAFMSRSSISTQTRWHIYLTQETGLANNEDEATQVVTQAVRDWLKRAGCV